MQLNTKIGSHIKNDVLHTCDRQRHIHFFCPFAGTSASPMDRIAYIPGTSPGFPSGAYNTSPISPGTKQHTHSNKHNMVI